MWMRLEPGRWAARGGGALRAARLEKEKRLAFSGVLLNREFIAFKVSAIPNNYLKLGGFPLGLLC